MKVFVVGIKIFKSFQAEEIPSIKIYHYCGSLNFASRNAFKTDLCSLIGVNLAKETKKMLKFDKYDPIYMKCLILDFSALSYIDPSGVSFLILLVKEFEKLQIHVFISGCSCKLFLVFHEILYNQQTYGQVLHMKL